MARIHVLQHVSFEGPGTIATWSDQRGHLLSVTELFNTKPLPEVTQIENLVILGGPMSVHDEDKHSWLKPEKKFIRECIDQGRKVLGICLGAQLVAEVLGGHVFKNETKEIGWFPIELTSDGKSHSAFSGLTSSIIALHWHGETFTLPKEATHLARSLACENQAFTYSDNVLALQFHLEMTHQGARDLALECEADLKPSQFVQTPESFLSNTVQFEKISVDMAKVLDNFFI